MDNNEYNKIFKLEHIGETTEAFALLEQLANDDHPKALLDLSNRYISIEGFQHPVWPLKPNHKKSQELAFNVKVKLEELQESNDGEAIRMLAYTYLGHWGPHFEQSRI